MQSPYVRSLYRAWFNCYARKQNEPSTALQSNLQHVPTTSACNGFFWKCFDSHNDCQFAGLRCNRKLWKNATVIRCPQSQGGVRMFCIPLHKDDTGTNRDECVTVADLCTWNPCVCVLGPLGLKKNCGPLHKNWSFFRPQCSFSLGGSDFGPNVYRFLGFQIQ